MHLIFLFKNKKVKKGQKNVTKLLTTLFSSDNISSVSSLKTRVLKNCIKYFGLVYNKKVEYEVK